MTGSTPSQDASSLGTHLRVLASSSLLGGAVVSLGIVLAWRAWGVRVLADSLWLGPWAWIVPGLAASWLRSFLLLAVLLGLAGVAGGIGLFLRAEWGRVLTLFLAAAVGLLAVASITLIPLAYSLYAFWVLTRPGVVDAFSTPLSAVDLPAEGSAGKLGPP